jgi:DNA topoisomerase-1
MHFYKPYVLSDIETDLPELQKDDVLRNVVVRMESKFTQPPPRFNQASLLAKMEGEKIGTKATRSEVISTLLKRNYISTTGTAIKATDIGFEIIQSMRKYIPDVVSTNLTRSMEEQLECIESGKAKSSLVIDYAKCRLREAIIPFKENEAEIGREITNAVAISQNKDQQQQVVLGACPICNNGVLKIIRSVISKKRFVGCSNYSSGICKASAPLPQKGSIKTTRKTCIICNWPIVKARYDHQANLHWEFCINIQCPSRRA